MHTRYPKGKTVWLRLKDGSEHIGKFEARTSRHIVLDCGKFEKRHVKAMSQRKHKPGEC